MKVAPCQDNELSWIDWSLQEKNDDLLEFSRFLLALRLNHPVFRRRHFFQERGIKNTGVHGINWYSSKGEKINEDEWNTGNMHHLGMLMDGKTIEEYDERGRLIRDDNFLLLLNSGPKTISFKLDFLPDNLSWQLVLDTGRQSKDSGRGKVIRRNRPYTLQDRSLVLMVQQGA